MSFSDWKFNRAVTALQKEEEREKEQQKANLNLMKRNH